MSLNEVVGILKNNIPELLLAYGVFFVIQIFIEREYFKLYLEKKTPKHPEFFKVYLSFFWYPYGYRNFKYYLKLIFENHTDKELNIFAKTNLILLFVVISIISLVFVLPIL